TRVRSGWWYFPFRVRFPLERRHAIGDRRRARRGRRIGELYQSPCVAKCNQHHPRRRIHYLPPPQLCLPAVLPRRAIALTRVRGLQLVMTDILNRADQVIFVFAVAKIFSSANLACEEFVRFGGIVFAAG